MPVRFAILGAGGIANQFADALRKTDGAELVAVASKSLERAESFAQRNAVPAAYGSYADMLERDDVDIVYVATTHNFHADNIRQCLEAGKSVICEKPMVLTEADAKSLFALAEEKNLFLMEAMWSRFIPSIQKAREWIASGRIGDLVSVSAVIGFDAGDNLDGRILNPALAGGAIYDIGVYPLEIVSYLVGEPVSSVQSAVRRHPVTGVDTTVNMIVRYPSVDAAITCTVRSNACEYVIVNGTRGCIEMPHANVGCEAVLYGHNRAKEEEFRYPPCNGFVFEAAEAVRCIREGKRFSETVPPEMTIETARIYETVLGEKS